MLAKQARELSRSVLAVTVFTDRNNQSVAVSPGERLAGMETVLIHVEQLSNAAAESSPKVGLPSWVVTLRHACLLVRYAVFLFLFLIASAEAPILKRD